MHRRNLLALAAAAASISLGLPAPAVAASRTRQPSWPGLLGASKALRGSTTPTPSTDFAGYMWGNSDSEITTSADFVVPMVKHCTTTNTAIVPGAAVNSPDGESSAGIVAGCQGGKAVYYVRLAIDSVVHSFPSLKARPGDKIAVNVAMGVPGSIVSLVDSSRKHVKKTMSGPGASVVVDPEIGDLPLYGTSALDGVPNFGTVSFTHATFDGFPIGAFSSNDIQFERYNGSTLQIATSSLSGKGNSFSTAFQHS